MAATAGFAVERLEPGDVPLMEALSDMFAEAFDEVALHRGKRPDAAWLERLLASDTFIALAALNGNEVIGGIVAYELPKYEQPRSEIHLYDLAVAEAHRSPRRLGKTKINNLNVSENDRF